MTSRALILVAAGSGQRAGGEFPKQYRPLAGKPLLQHTIDNAQGLDIFSHIVLVVAADDERAPSLKGPMQRVIGGATRTASVRAGLAALRGRGFEDVFIHDGARPFLTAALVQPLVKALRDHDGAVPALPIADALKSEDFSPVDRTRLRRVQTPQAFRYGRIMAVFDALPDDTSAHDDVALAAAAGLDLAYTLGQESNMKVTYPDDFARAERQMAASGLMVSGTGFDVHRLETSDKPLMICGVEIDSPLSLVGHSDADVGLHAITDAVLGAVALGDIGDHFPPSDDRWKGAASDQFLRHALELAQGAAARLLHVDLTLICERPKIKPAREAMRARVAEITGLPLARVSIKATTTEGLGFTGRREGIAAQAVATVVIDA